MSIYTDLVKLEQDIVAGADVQTLWADVKAVGDDLIGQPVMKSIVSEDIVKQVEAVKTAAEARMKGVKAAPVDKIGDGAILKLILEALPMILALFGK